MNTALLKTKIEEAGRRVSDAEHELEASMLTLTNAQGGGKTLVAKQLESAFSKLREAKRHLADLNDLLDGEANEPRAAERACPTCSKTIMAAASRCGHCWTKLI